MERLKIKTEEVGRELKGKTGCKENGAVD